MMRFFFPHSHAFPRGRVVVDDDGKPEGLVEFGDGVLVLAKCRRLTDGAILLAVPSYRTRKRTQVAARTWRLVQRKDGVWRSERVE